MHGSFPSLKVAPDKEFLEGIGKHLTPKVSVSDAFRRKFVFSTLESFIAQAPSDQRGALRDLLLAQLHDEAMRSLILQGLASQDAGLLYTFGKLGFNAAVLNEFQADLCPELANRLDCATKA